MEWNRESKQLDVLYKVSNLVVSGGIHLMALAMKNFRVVTFFFLVVAVGKR